MRYLWLPLCYTYIKPNLLLPEYINQGQGMDNMCLVKSHSLLQCLFYISFQCSFFLDLATFYIHHYFKRSSNYSYTQWFRHRYINECILVIIVDYTEPCVDRISYCNLYDLDDACVNYRGWARHNCKQSCAVCI